MQPAPASAAHAIGPYRGAPPAERLRPGGVLVPRTLVECRLVDAVALDIQGNLTSPRMGVLHTVMAVLTFGPLLAVAIGIPLGWPAVAALPAVIFAALFGWVWVMGVRGNRTGALINEDRWAEAEHAIGTRRFGTEILAGLCAQMRGDHAQAEEIYHRGLQVFENRRAHLQPVHAQGYARQALALVNLGRPDWAQARLARMPVTGDYLTALHLVASAYLLLGNGQPLPRDMVTALCRTFRPVRGAWGGLALAAYGQERLGDAVGAQELLAEERARVGAAALVPVMPRLAAWAQQRGQPLG
ncbi:MAG: hypothetical protein WKG00_37940 [Polyangiaceae bacterium]